MPDSKENKYVTVLTTFSKKETGDKITDKLLKDQLAACIQALPIRSSYTWKGSICHDEETLLLIKAKRADYKAIEEAIRSVHDYETPEIIALPVELGSNRYLTWIDEVTR